MCIHTAFQKVTDRLGPFVPTPQASLRPCIFHTVGISLGYLLPVRVVPQFPCVLSTSIIQRPRSSFAGEEKASKGQHEIEQEVSGQIWFNRSRGPNAHPNSRDTAPHVQEDAHC